jgi:hypothetical protein
VLAAARSESNGANARDRTTIDEVQRVPDLSRAIKKSVDDDDRQAGRFVDGLSHYILGSDDGFKAICILQKEPTPERSQWIENAACRKIFAPVIN